MVAIPEMLLHYKSDYFWVITVKTPWPGVQVDFVQALLPEFLKKSNSWFISPKSKQTMY
jgi:hypothetical protein